MYQENSKNIFGYSALNYLYEKAYYDLENSDEIEEMKKVFTLFCFVV